LQTGRTKDILRVTMFLEQASVEISTLKTLCEKFELSDKLSRVLATLDQAK
jgi:hypothetical protein